MFKFKKTIISLTNILLVFIISNKTYASAENSGINYISYFGSLLFFLVIFAGVIFLAMYLTKFIAKKSNDFGKGKNLKILEVVNISGQVKIVTIKMHEKVYILSIANNHTTVIDKLELEDLGMDFEDYLNQNIRNNNSDFNPYFDSLKDLKDKIFKKIKDSPKDKE